MTQNETKPTAPLKAVKKPSLIKTMARTTLNLSIPALFIAPGALLLTTAATPAVLTIGGLAIAYGAYNASETIFRNVKTWQIQKKASGLSAEEGNTLVSEERNKMVKSRFSLPRTGLGMIGNTIVAAASIAVLMTGPALIPAAIAIGALGYSVVTGAINTVGFGGNIIAKLFKDELKTDAKAPKQPVAESVKPSKAVKPAGNDFKNAANQNTPEKAAPKKTAKKPTQKPKKQA